MENIFELSNKYLRAFPVESFPQVIPTIELSDLMDSQSDSTKKVLSDFNESTEPVDITDWKQFQNEVLQQYKFLLSEGFRFEFTKDDPYATAKDLHRAVCSGETIRIYSDGEELQKNHPSAQTCEEFGVSYNELARAVHDVFGHMGAETGYNDFSTIGELQAYKCHCRMFSTKARRAFFVDFPAQSVWVESNNPKPVHLQPIEELIFAPQKAYKPVWWC